MECDSKNFKIIELADLLEQADYWLGESIQEIRLFTSEDFRRRCGDPE